MYRYLYLTFSEGVSGIKVLPKPGSSKGFADRFARQMKQPLSYTWYMFDACQGGIGVWELVLAVPCKK